jgi:hypothetical protein
MKITKEIMRRAKSIMNDYTERAWGEDNTLSYHDKLGVCIKIAMEENKKSPIPKAVKHTIEKTHNGNTSTIDINLSGSEQIIYTIDGGKQHRAKKIENGVMSFYGTEKVVGVIASGIKLDGATISIEKTIDEYKKRELAEEERIITGLIKGTIKIDIKNVGCYYDDWQPWVNETSWHEYDAQKIMSDATRRMLKMQNTEYSGGNICDVLKRAGKIEKECSVTLESILGGYKAPRIIVEHKPTHCWECGCRSSNLDEDGYCGC